MNLLTKDKNIHKYSYITFHGYISHVIMFLLLPVQTIPLFEAYYISGVIFFINLMIDQFITP